MDWLIAVTPSVAFAIGLYCAREWIAAKLTKSIQSKYDRELEALRSQFRNKEAEFNALRTSVLSSASERRAAVERRRLEAVDQLWSAVEHLGKLKILTAYMKVIKFEEFARETARNPNARQVVEVIAGQIDLDGLKTINGGSARPFVSQKAWALFSAYSSILYYAAAQITILRTGVGKPELLSDETMVRLVKAALPHQVPYIDKVGSAAANYLVDELEDAILLELQRMLSGEDDTKEAMQQANEILKLSNDLDEKRLQATSAAT